MPHLRPSVIAFAAVLFASGAAVSAAQSDWQKTYPTSVKPSLTFTTGDAATELRSCGDCREIRIRVQWNGRNPDDFPITEAQTGDHVSFELRERTRMHIMIGVHHSPQVFIETPAAIDVEGRTADGSLHVSGVRGELQFHTGDGSVDIDDSGGAVRLVASDGSIRMHNLSGTLESRSSDGSVRIDGQFTGIQVHTSDGNLDLTLNEASHLSTASRIESSDGRVSLHLPRTLAADLEIHTSDGRVQCDLPLTMEGYNSKSDSGHSLRGHLNGGGVPLYIHTSDGNVTIDAMHPGERHEHP
jgi:hypothetical protein